MEYTFTFERDAESKFREVLSRLDEEEYTVIKDMYLVKPEEPRYSDREMVIAMEPDACLTFRLGMKAVKIRRARTEEELAEEKAINDRNTIKVTIQVPMSAPAAPPTP
jgi:hypothetical protein